MLIQPEKRFTLSTKNTLAAPSVAEYFYVAKNAGELQAATDWARSNKLSISLLGGGSNVLLSENISALVVQPVFLGKNIIKEDASFVWVNAGAGENWHAFTQWSIDSGYFGLENLSLIPGSVGAAPIQNIGAYGVEVASLIEQVQVFDLHSGETRWLNADECGFAYRDSIFKHELGRVFVVINVLFKLNKAANIHIDYPALQSYINDQNIQSAAPTPRQVANAVIAIRQSKLPSVDELPNAGSFFKNPIIAEQQAQALLSTHTDMPCYDAGAGLRKIAAAWLIDRAGWKGQSINGISVHESQALVLINPSAKPLADILHFASQVQADVQKKFGIQLEIEPQQLKLLPL